MKPIIQKLPLEDDTSFVARTYRTPIDPVYRRIQGYLLGAIIWVNLEEGDVFFIGKM